MRRGRSEKPREARGDRTFYEALGVVIKIEWASFQLNSFGSKGLRRCAYVDLIWLKATRTSGTTGACVRRTGK